MKEPRSLLAVHRVFEGIDVDRDACRPAFEGYEELAEENFAKAKNG